MSADKSLENEKKKTQEVEKKSGHQTSVAAPRLFWRLMAWGYYWQRKHDSPELSAVKTAYWVM